MYIYIYIFFFFFTFFFFAISDDEDEESVVLLPGPQRPEKEAIDFSDLEEGRFAEWLKSRKKQTKKTTHYYICKELDFLVNFYK